MKKIMFNDKCELTQAVLDGRKTMTRRIITPQPTYSHSKGMIWKGYAYGTSLCFTEPFGSYRNFLLGTNQTKSARRYQVGEEIAIAQSYKDVADYYGNSRNFSPKEYLLNACEKSHYIKSLRKDEAGWNNKMFVSAGTMPHRIRITDVRIERLQDISDEDCMKEGVIKWDAGQTDIPFYTYPNAVKCDYDTPREAFAALIDKVSGRGTWKRNPFVWVYEFELIK